MDVTDPAAGADQVPPEQRRIISVVRLPLGVARLRNDRTAGIAPRENGTAIDRGGEKQIRVARCRPGSAAGKPPAWTDKISDVPTSQMVRNITHSKKL